jgi:intracellular multiplication protein IcmE
MTEPIEPTLNDNNNAGIPDGFVDETRTNHESVLDGTQGSASTGKSKKSAELKNNFLAVFGHGIGKFSLIAIIIVIIIMTALAVRGFSGNKQVINVKTQTDVPGAPKTSVSVDPITRKEADRRIQITTKEANDAASKKQTYQPDFVPAIAAENSQPPVPPSASASQHSPASASSPSASPKQTQEEKDAERRAQTAYEKQVKARDDEVNKIYDSVKKQVDTLLDKGGKEGGIRSTSSYTTVSYLPKPMAAASEIKTSIAPASSTPDRAESSNVMERKNTVFKAGNIIYATLDAEVNTDDGGAVFATVRGGQYNGSKLIGKIETAPNNMRLHFMILSPQDDRPALHIDALGIREEDAKQGVAETIDHHILSRYSSLLISSMFSGLGQAAAQPQGETTILPNGQTVVSNSEVSNKRILMYAAGNAGTSAASEIRKNFGQPTTYATPANKGIGVIFLTDVSGK